MNQADAKAQVSSEESADYGDVSIDNVRLVPVAESIRYRKRAQQAEKRIEGLTEQLNHSQSDADNLAGYVKELEFEQQLTRKLAAAGASDLETAILVAKKRATAKDDTDLDSIVEQLKSEKGHLFGAAGSADLAEASFRTTPAKDRLAPGRSVLEKAARKAAVSGSRVDLQEYLKLRRNFI